MQNKHTVKRITDSHAQDEHSTETRNQRFFASFATHRIDVPYVEVTVVARSRQQAKQIAREVVRPLGLHSLEVD